MDTKIPGYVIELMNRFAEAGHEIYIVGGAVRDLLMGKEVDDWDFTTDATPKEMLKIIPDGFYDNNFGTVGVSRKHVTKNPEKLDPEAQGEILEITTFRKEFGYSDNRRPDKVVWGKNLDEDLARRDFTINAMALKPANGSQSTADGKKKHTSSGLDTTDFHLIDPFGGQKDLERKLIRAVGNPDKRFSEDALRMMRAVRIGGELNFRIEKKTLEAIWESATLINQISAERVKMELFKILASPRAFQGVTLLRESGLLKEILPELESCFGVEQKSPGRHHVYDVGTHSLMSLKFCPSMDPVVRFATLIHDIGKAETYNKLSNGTITFYNHELYSGRMAKDIARRLRLSKEESDKLWRLVRYHQFTVDENQTDSAVRRFIRRVGKENVVDMLNVRTGDRLGGGASETSWRLEEFKKRLVEVQKQPFSVRDLKIDGKDVMKELRIKPGPKVGEVLNKLFEKVENKEVENDRGKLLKALKNEK